MVEVTQTMFRRILIYALGAVFLTAGGVRAQQPEVEARIAGLEGNAEYMSLLREDAQLPSSPAIRASTFGCWACSAPAVRKAAPSAYMKTLRNIAWVISTI